MNITGLPFNVYDLVNTVAVEHNRVEFKGTWDEHIKVAVTKTVCAFGNDLLNLNGGYIVLGIDTDEQGTAILPPRGLAGFDLDLIQREIRGQCRRIQPEYQPVLFPATYQDRAILVIWAPGGDNRPYQAPIGLSGADRAYYVRQGSENVEAKGEILRQLLERTARIPFDDRRNQNARIEDISPTLVRRFLADVRSDLINEGVRVDDRELYRKLRIVAPINEHEVPRNIGLLFFNEDPNHFFPGTRIEIVQFADDAGGNLIEERAIRGPLPEQLRKTLDSLNSLGDILLEKVPGRAEVDRTVAYPYEAMEEAIVNAVYHRSYEGATEPTKVYFYPDRMEIISYPGPVPGIERNHLLPGSVVPPVPARNRRIGELLKELRLTEMRGTGLPKIRRKMGENGSPEPIFDFDNARTYFRVTLPVHPRYGLLHALRESAHLWAIGDRSGAIAHLERAHLQQPGSGAIAAQIIEYALANDDLDLARRILASFHQAGPKSEIAQPYLGLARALLDRNETAEARRILSLIPSATSHRDIVEAAVLRKRAADYEEAHRLFAQVYPDLRDDPKVVQEFAQTKLALARQLRGPKDSAIKKRLNQDAVELLHRAIQLSTDNVRTAWCWFDLARTLAWLREPATDVEAAFLKAIALRPDEARFERGYQDWKRRSQTSRRYRR
jgi:ATP-dependent DNA helicase RecG